MLFAECSKNTARYTTHYEVGASSATVYDAAANLSKALGEHDEPLWGIHLQKKAFIRNVQKSATLNKMLATIKQKPK